MANYCSCKLTITSSNADFINTIVSIAAPPLVKPGFLHFLDRVMKRPSDPRTSGLLEFLRPMPPDLRQTITNGYSGEEPPWRKWMVDNWGCAYDFIADECRRLNENQVLLRFMTMYSPPLSALTFGAKEHDFQFELYYCDAGGGFCGIATESDHTEYEIMLDLPPAEEGIPQELIDEFDLMPIYEDIQKDRKLHPDAYSNQSETS